MKCKISFLILLIFLIFSAPTAIAADLEVHIINVGQGDCFLITSPTGVSCLIDAGKNGKGTGIVLPHLNTLGITSLNYIVASHYHEDHIGGIDEVVNGLGGSSYIINAAYDRGGSYSTNTYTDYVTAIGAKRAVISPNDTIDLGSGVSITCVAAGGYTQDGQVYSGSDENTLSVVLVLSYYNFQMYFGGDCTSTIEDDLAPYAGDVDVYKVSHHGSKTSSSQILLNYIKPEVSTISVGDGNHYGHPHIETITRLVNMNSYIYQTETGSGTLLEGDGEIANGDFKFETDGYLYKISGSALSPRTYHTDEIPIAPSDLSARAKSSSEIILSWFDNSSNEEGFKIERREGEDGEWNQIQETGANVQSFIDEGLATNITYYYRVRAFNTSGNSDYSNIAECTLLTSYVISITAGIGGTTNPAPGIYNYDVGTDVIITAIPESGYRFSGWTGDVPSGHENDNPITMTMDSDKSITANFIRQYTLTIASGTGGTTDPSPGTYTYDKGTEVTVRAIPDNHYIFNGWSGNISGKTNPITVTMNSDKSITANFIRIIYPPLNFNGQKVLNRSLSQAEYINVLTWQANPNNENIEKYRIYQIEGESKSLLVELDTNTFEYWHRRVEKDKQYMYALLAVNDEGGERDPAYITVQ